MKTYLMLAALILAPMTAAAFDFSWRRVDAADENVRGVILQEMAGYRDSSLEPIKISVKAAKTGPELVKARMDFESWKTAAMQKRYADGSKSRIKAYFESQTSLVNALRAHVQSSGWGSYFDGAKPQAPVQEAVVEVPAPVASVRYNYGKVRGIAMSQGAKAAIVNAAIEEAMMQGVDPNLVLAIIQKESGYQARAVSSSGALGLMQLMPSTACDMGVCDSERLLDPRTNIRAGIKYLRWMTNYLKLDVNLQNIKQSSGNHLRALIASYNAGLGTVQRWRKQQGENFQILYAETRNYVSQVLDVLGMVGW